MKLAAPRVEAMPEWQQRSGFSHTCKFELFCRAEISAKKRRSSIYVRVGLVELACLLTDLQHPSSSASIDDEYPDA